MHPNYWTVLRPQIAAWIEDELKWQGWDEAQLLAVLDKEGFNHDLFRKTVFNYEQAKFTLQQLCQTFEMLIGSSLEFEGALKYRIRELLMDNLKSEVA